MAEPGGWETWQWDESLFAGAASYYVEGRLPYAPGIADALAEALELNGTGRLLDVGCGPGTITLRLAARFAEAVGLDPDPGMLAEAAEQAARAGVTNATWVRHRAEDLPAGLGHFRMVTFAASFHWMDRPAVAAAAREMLVEGGAAVQVDAPGYRVDEVGRDDLPYPSPPDAEVAALVRRYLGPDRRAGRTIRNTSPSGEDEVFQAAGFEPATVIVVPDGRVVELTIENLVARSFSNSGSVRHQFGDRVDDFERDLRALIAGASPTGRFAVRLPDNVLRVWRPRRP